MRVYIAAPYIARDWVREYVVPLLGPDFQVVSSWLYGARPLTVGHLGTSPDRPDEEVTKHARDDLSGVALAEAVLLLSGSFLRGSGEFTDEYLHTGGRHVEVGFALARAVPVVVVGEPENVFERTLCEVAPSLPAALKILRELGRVYVEEGS